MNATFEPNLKWRSDQIIQITIYTLYSLSVFSLAKSLPLILEISATYRAELFKAGLRKPRISARFEFRYESLKSISILILFVYKLEALQITEKITGENGFEHKKRKPGLYLAPCYELIGLRTAGPRIVSYLLADN